MSEPDSPPEPDFDTEWFAVDRDGHVGWFVNNYGGAMPRGATTDDDGELLASLEERPGAVVAERAGFETIHESVDRDTELDFVAFLTSRDDLTLLPGARELGVDGAGAAVIANAEALAAVHQEPARCVTCVFEYTGIDAAARGVFAYQADDAMGTITIPYHRVARPASPVRLDELPEAIRALVGKVRLDVSFADKPCVQPLEHGPCDAPEATWLDARRTLVRMVPGMQAKSADWVDDLRAELDALGVPFAGELPTPPAAPPDPAHAAAPTSPASRRAEGGNSWIVLAIGAVAAIAFGLYLLLHR